MKHFERHILVATLATLALASAGTWLVAAERPNIVLILADDLGYGDVHALNESSTIPTPNLDRLASEGMTFTDAHTPSAVCTPTRYGVVTGRYCWRSRLTRGVLGGSSPRLIDLERLTIAAALKSRGYFTAVVGKWHLGLDWTRSIGAGGKESRDAKKRASGSIDFEKPVRGGPVALGFDFFFGVPASLDMAPYVFVENDRVVESPTITQAAMKFPAFARKGPRARGLVFENTLDDLTEKARGVILERARSESPFFLYFPLTAPHKPVIPHPRFRGATALGPYGDFVTQVDSTIGRVLDAIDEAKIRSNTLVIFTSDNGSFMYRRDANGERDHVDDPSVQAYRADRHRSNHVFRGTKADIFEGGHRVPFLVRWPDVVSADSRRAETICLTDIMATCAEIAGLELPDDAAEDSFSFLPLLRGKTPGEQRAPVIHHSANGVFAMRMGRWKLIFGNGSGGREQPRGKPFAPPYQLFDLWSDIRETKNLASEHPALLRNFEVELGRIRSEGRSRPRMTGR